MLARDRDHLRRRVDARDLGAQPRQRLGQQPRAAADVERRLPRQRRRGCTRRTANAGRSGRGYISAAPGSACAASPTRPSGSHQSPACAANCLTSSLDDAGHHAPPCLFRLAKGKGLCVGRAMDHFQLEDGELYCEDVPLAEIAAEVGTPVYVYSTATMRRHVAALSALRSSRFADPLIAYAVKANPNSAVHRDAGGRRARRRRRLGRRVSARARGRRAARQDRLLRRRQDRGGDAPWRSKAGSASSTSNRSRKRRCCRRVAAALGRTAPVGFRVNPDVDAGTPCQDHHRRRREQVRHCRSATRSRPMPASPRCPASRSRASPSTSAAS